MRRLGELYRLLNRRTGSLNATYKKNTNAKDNAYDLNQKYIQALDVLAAEYVAFEAHHGQMSQASTMQEMYYTQRPWKWLKSSNEPTKIKAVSRTIWTARARHWPQQPKNFQTAVQHTRPRALHFATSSGTFATADHEVICVDAKKTLHRTLEIKRKASEIHAAWS